MRTLAFIGTLFFTAGVFLCTRGTGGHFVYIISGAVVGLLGLLILGLTASNQEPHVSARRVQSKSKSRLRRRATTGIRSLRMRRTPVGAAGGR